MGCTAGELRAGLQLALPGAQLAVDSSAALATFEDGALQLRWNPMAPRRIALLELPRLSVSFRYSRLTPERRFEVQRRFDLVYQRGGG